MKIAIIGSRERSFFDIIKTKKEVEDLVDSLYDDDIVISGGCRGVDVWAISRAKSRGLITKEYFPNIKKNMLYGDMVNAYYKRNRKIVDNSDVIYAFPSIMNKGGTGYTIEYAIKKGKKVFIK